MIYRFDDFELDTAKFELRHRGEARHVEPLVFDLIGYFCANAGRVVTRDEIIAHVWSGRIVSDATVASCVKSARKALSVDTSDTTYIRTVRGRGFSFEAAVGSTTTVAIEAAPTEMKLREAEPQAPAPTDDLGVTALGGQPSIAVLPLHSLTADERFGAVGDAISQEVIVELSRLHWLFVIARGSSFRFRGASIDIVEAGRILGARYVLTGTISIVGQTSVVTLELAHTTDDRVVWAERFETSLEELLQLRTAISSKVVAAVETRIHLAEVTAAARLSTESLDAWSAYHRGLWHMYRFRQSDNATAAGLFRRAIEIDPRFARAYAGLSFTHFQDGFLGFANDFDAEVANARRFAEKSYECDPLDPFSTLMMGRASWLEGDIDAGLPWLNRSAELSPNYAFAIYNRAVLGTLCGEGDQSQKDVVKAMALSPIDPLAYAMLSTRGLAHFVRGDYAGGADWANRATREPNAHVHIYAIAAMLNDLAGDAERAKKCAAQVRLLSPTFDQATFFRSFGFRDPEMRALASGALRRLGI
jgi:TolB-like protein